jgi:hypothetical protein
MSAASGAPLLAPASVAALVALGEGGAVGVAEPVADVDADMSFAVAFGVAEPVCEPPGVFDCEAVCESEPVVDGVGAREGDMSDDADTVDEAGAHDEGDAGGGASEDADDVPKIESAFVPGAESVVGVPAAASVGDCGAAPVDATLVNVAVDAGEKDMAGATVAVAPVATDAGGEPDALGGTSGEPVPVCVGVRVAVADGVAAAVGVAVPESEPVGVELGVGVAEPESDGVGDAVRDGDARHDSVPGGDAVPVGVSDVDGVLEKDGVSCVGDTVAVASVERVRFDVVDTVEHDDADAGAVLGSSAGATTEGDDVTHADGVQPRTKGSVVVVIVMELSAARCGANAAGVTAKPSDGTARDTVMCIVPHIPMAARMIAATEKQSTRVRTAYTYLPRGAACGRATTSPRASYRHGQHIGILMLSSSHSVIG